MLNHNLYQGHKVSKWRLCSEYPLKIYLSQDEAVVYHSGSGDTHLLNFLAYRILVFFEISLQATNQEVESYIINNLDLEMDQEELHHYINRTLEQFSALNLIEKTQS